MFLCLQVTIELSMCSNRGDDCLAKVTFLKDAVIPMISCSGETTGSISLDVTRPPNAPGRYIVLFYLNI